MAQQVYGLTHEGERHLSLVDTQFYNFKYGDKCIDEFNFLRVTLNNRLDLPFSASYQDTTTQVSGVDGQIFWGTSYDALTITIHIATDGATVNDINALKAYFRPGYERELTLSEYGNRFIMARVASVPELSLLPFQYADTIKHGNEITDVFKTTLYKGEGTITFICDFPFWQARKICKKENNNSPDENWQYTDGFVYENNEKHFEDDGDWGYGSSHGANIHIMVVDNPTEEEAVYQLPILLGHNVFAREIHKTKEVSGEIKRKPHIEAFETNKTHGTEYDWDDDDKVWRKRAGTDFTLDLAANTDYTLYYPGTAKSALTLKFKQDLSVNRNTGKVNFANSTAQNYATITLTYSPTQEAKVFNYVLPSVIVGLNQASDIILSTPANTLYIDIEANLRDNIFHYQARKTALNILQALKEDSSEAAQYFDSIGKLKSGKVSAFRAAFVAALLRRYGDHEEVQNNVATTVEVNSFPITFNFDAKKGDTEITYHLYNSEGTGGVNRTEKAGDCIRSPYLYIEGQTPFNEYGYICTTNSHLLKFNNSITDLQFYYDWLYK